MGLKQIEFQDFVTLQRGYDLPVHQMKDGDIPVLGSNCIVGYHNEAKVQPPGVVTGRSGTLGIVQFTDKPFWPHNTSLWVKDFKGNDPKFVYYKLQTLKLDRFNGGASVPTLNRNVLDTLKIRVPKVLEQQRFSSILSNYDDLIETNRRRIQLLEESASLLYKEWFVHLRFPGYEHVKIKDGIPEGWEKVPIRTICAEVKELINPKNIEPDTPYIGLEHIPRKSITLSGWGTASKVSSTKHRFTAGDILFGKIRSYFHKVGFTLTDGITSSDAIVIRPLDMVLWPITLMLTSSDQFVNVSAKTAKEGSKMPRADWHHMQSYPLFLPPKPILLFFNESILNVTSMLKSLALQNRKLTQARDLLLPRLMNGEITA